MTKYSTLQEAIENLTPSKLSFRCAIIVRREKKTRWKDVEDLISASVYGSRLYYDYMVRLCDRGKLSQSELFDIKQAIGITDD